VPARRCLAGRGREHGWVGVAACFPGDPYGDVVTPGWFVHVWHCKRGMRHFRLRRAGSPGPAGCRAMRCKIDKFTDNARRAA